MKTIYEIICGIIFVLLNVTLVSVVYYYNRHPINKYGGIKLKPEELSKVIAKEIGSQPQFYTYEQKENGTYRVYQLSHTDNLTYEEKEFDYPVDFNGVRAKPMSELNFKLLDRENGFQVPGINQSFECPENYKWNKELKKCIEKPICNDFNNSVKRLYDRFYSEIDNPSITKVTPLNGKTPHPRLYIRCSSLQQKAIIEACSEENEQVDDSAFVNLTYHVNNISIKPCKIYDICENNPDDTCHAYRINNNFSQALKINEYYKCDKSKSTKRQCQQGYQCNEMSRHNNDICKPKDHCRPNIDYYFTTNPNSFYHCLSNKRQNVPCGENGIIKLSDNSYQCKTDNTYVYYDNYFAKESQINGFKYKSKLLKGLQKTKLSWVFFDEWFNEKFPQKFKLFPYLLLPTTSIEINSNDSKFEYRDNDSQRKFYENINDIQLPKKFYYPNDGTEKWTLFNEQELLKSINDITLESKIIHLSTSNLMPEISFKIKFLDHYNSSRSTNPDDYYDNLKIVPADYGLSSEIDFWIIFNGNVYKYEGKNGNIIKITNESKYYYSFIGAMLTEPTKLSDGKIIGKALKEVEGIYYGLCLKHNSDFKFNGQTIKHLSLTTFSVQNPIIISKLSINLDNLIQDGTLPKNFPTNDFSWDKLYVGKYYYDKENQKLIVWHDHLFVLKLQPFITEKLKEKNKELIIDDDGQFIYYNYPKNIVDITYENSSYEDKKKKYLTALATTFSYYKDNYKTPVVHWLSYLPVDPACLKITQAEIDSSTKLDFKKDNSILKYLTIIYPKLKQSTLIDTLLNMIQLNQFTLTLDDM